MDDSTQSLCSDTIQPAWDNVCLTLSIKLATLWPSGNKNQSSPPSQSCWVLRWRCCSFNLSWAALSAICGSTRTRNVLLHLNLKGFPVWSCCTRALQSFAVLVVLPTFPNGGEDLFAQSPISMTYTPPGASFFSCFLCFVVVVPLLLEPFFVLGTGGLGLRLVSLDPVEGRWLWPVLWLPPRFFASSAGSEESAPVLL